MKKTLNSIFSDIPASIVVFLVALPLCLGIALGSGAPLFSGIISGIIGGIVIGTLSGSSLSVSGPAAGLIAIIVMGLDKLGSFEAFLLAVFIAGIFQIIFGFLKLGLIGDFIPNTVIKGMLAAIGVILILKQIPHFVGYDKYFEGDESFFQADHENTFSILFKMVNSISPLAIIIGLISVIILLLWETKSFKKNQLIKFIPAPLVVVVIGSIINSYFSFVGSNLALKEEHLVFLPMLNNLSDLNNVLPSPNWNEIFNQNVWIIAVTIALVASIETLLCIEATDKIDPLKRSTPVNLELKAQGFGNAISGLLGGLPITSVIVRSSANVNAGAVTKASSIMHGFWLLLSVIFIPTLLNKIPYSALAAILIMTGYKLAKPSILNELHKRGYDQLIPFITTVAAILFTDLLVGVLIGIVVSFAFILRSNYQSAIMVINDDNQYLVRLRKDVSFLNKAELKKILEEIPSNSNILIDITRSDFIDKDVIDVINDFLRHASLKNLKIDIKKNQFNKLHQLIH
jgi:MFS superfamily sulfate permease-like transporter